jgi:hypothetical protein
LPPARFSSASTTMRRPRSADWLASSTKAAPQAATQH